MGILLYSSWKSDELKADLRKGTNINQINSQLVDTYDPSRAAVLYALFVKNNTWQVPTLTIRHARPYLQELQASNDPRLKYMPSTIVESWGPHVDQRQPASPEVIASRKRLFQKELEVVASMHRAGVKLFAGTDTPNPYCFPGFSLHDELGFMVQAGLTPLEALQTATINPAEFLGLSKIFGTVEKDKIADLVPLDANPLENIANTKRIVAVVSSGRLLDRKTLDGQLIKELSPQTVQEFQVVNNGLSAESGGGASGPINVITKSGVNTRLAGLCGKAPVPVRITITNHQEGQANQSVSLAQVLCISSSTPHP